MSITLSRVTGIVADHQARVSRITRTKRHVFSPEEADRGIRAAHAALRANGRAAYTDLAVVMKELRDGGLTFDAVAQSLNAEGHRTRYGCLFDAANVYRIITKYAA